MLNIGNLIIESLDYIFIVDKDYNIIYNSRYDQHFNGRSSEHSSSDMLNKSFFEVYPEMDRGNSNVIRCMETQSVIVNKKQRYQDYLGRRYFTNNVAIPLRSKGKLIAVVELAVDVEGDDSHGEDGDKKFDEFILRLKKEADLITFDTILTRNDQMKACIEKAKFLSRLPNPTLLCGETGTGKELFAQAMITYSGVPRKKVVIQNCATVPENLMETYVKTRSEGFGMEVKRRIMLGNFVLSSGYYDAYYNKALKAKKLIQQAFFDAFEKYDMLLGPVAPTTALKLGENLSDPLKMYLGDIYTVMINIAGVPSMALPCGFDGAGLPIGMQFIGKPFCEAEILSAAAAFQQATDFHKQSPQQR